MKTNGGLQFDVIDPSSIILTVVVVNRPREEQAVSTLIYFSFILCHIFIAKLVS